MLRSPENLKLVIDGWKKIVILYYIKGAIYEKAKSEG